MKNKRKRNTHFVLRDQNWTAEIPEKRNIKLYSGIKRKDRSDKCFKLNYSIPSNSMKDPVEFLKMHKRKNTERI